MSEEGNYLAKLRRLIREGKIPPGSTNLVTVAHDDWCAVFRGEACNCNPDVSIRRPENN